MKRVLLLSAPFGSLERPALGVSLLKPALARRGVRCDVRYLTFTFADLVGAPEYRWISGELPYTAFAGDWSFTSALYGPDTVRDGRYVDEILRGLWHLDDRAIDRVLRVRLLTNTFLDHCLAAIDWKQYAVVGFTSTFEQNIASLALAKRIKSEHPHASIVFGGANWEGDMGHELHRQFPFVDYVCSGEADHSFPDLASRLVAGKRAIDPRHPIRGVVFRRRHESIFTGQAEVVRDLDRLPYPDYTDYFRDLEQSGASSDIVPTVLLETSRGCWWGAKSHCTFCGLNGGTMAFRSKSSDRALAELDALVDRWKTDTVEAVDNILDMRYFREFLPALAKQSDRVQLFYEVKANLSRDQVRLLSDAGVRRIQPGIESLSDHVLRLMRKGTTGLRNIQLLKWCKQFNIQVDWNILYGFPGETRSDYERMLELLPAIRFLQPPGVCAPIRLDRFSPYFVDAENFGLINVRPMAPYQYLYPFDDQTLGRIAYYFDFDYRPECDPSGFADPVIKYIDAAQRTHETGTLTATVVHDDKLYLRDTRSDRTLSELVLEDLEKEAYEFCDEMRPSAAVTRHLQATFPCSEVTQSQTVGFLDSLVANRLMVGDGNCYLSLAIQTPAIRHKPPLQRAVVTG